MSYENESDVITRLGRLERGIGELRDLLLGQQKVKDLYSTGEAASILGKAEYTVREWCRHGRVRAEKRACGRGRSKEWVISHEEVTRLRNQGLLPLPSTE